MMRGFCVGYIGGWEGSRGGGGVGQGASAQVEEWYIVSILQAWQRGDPSDEESVDFSSQKRKQQKLRETLLCAKNKQRGRRYYLTLLLQYIRVFK